MSIPIFIPSRGRAGNIKTIKALSTEVKKNELVMVVPKGEYHLHKEQPYFKEISNWMRVPDEIRLTEKRFRVLRWHVENGGDKMMFMDDDLLFSFWDKSSNSLKAVLKHKLQEEFCKRALTSAEKALDKYGCWSFAHAGIPTRQALLKEGTMFKTNVKCCNVFAYSAVKLLERTDHPAFIDRVWGIDTLWNVETIIRGDDLLLDYRLMMDAGFDRPVPGGAAPFRNTTDVHHAFLKMMMIHPGIIKRGKQGHHIHSFLRIDWRGAVAFRDPANRAKYLQRGAANLAAEFKHQGITSRDFLQSLSCAEEVAFFEKRLSKLRKYV